ncbi:MotA/TolQ/ExbB proton channel family protein [Sulfuricystis multivorans]|uniref:MotA/TolQ/ExbB proton channel family protein n=1 Tax=Sulfuricystis multivorans TaxID=2211108 RepID=UPI000F8462EB|nr:MotA/TolQ/ExbB proton channel family protein [Sulfuricystis multivorans]
MEPNHFDGFGFAHFLAQCDGVGKTVLALLLLLSVASWYLIVTRTLDNWLAKRRAQAYEARFDSTKTLDALPDDEPHALARLVAEARSVISRCAGKKNDAAFEEVLTRSLNNAIDAEMMRAEHGLTILATAGSAAPYIGLFGTVWGIYHALVQIGMSGQGTLDKVAGPVGEALIMTALGLAVAIPAVLAYNAFQRRNRLWLNRLESFAHRLYLELAVQHGQG